VIRVLVDARLAARGLGIATFVERLVGALSGDGSVEVRLWGEPGEWGTGSKVATLARSGLFDLSPRLDPRARGYDVVHYASNLGAVVPGRNSVVTVHDLMHRRPGTPRGNRIAGTVLERSLLRAGRVVVASDRTRAEVEEVVPALAGRVEVVPHGIRTLAVRTGPRSHVLAFGGASDSRKRTDLMVAAYGEYRATTPEALPLVVLSRAGLTPAQRATLVVAGARVVPTATRDEVDDLMAGAAALLYPTLQEGHGLPILEAAEAGTPVVIDAAADVASEVVGRHCVLVRDTRLEAWAEALRSAVAGGPVENSLELPGWPAVAARYRSLYGEVSRS